MWYHDFVFWARECGSSTGSHGFGRTGFHPKKADGKEYIVFGSCWGPEVNLGQWYSIKVKLDLKNDLGYLWLDNKLVLQSIPLGTRENFHFAPSITVEGGNDCHTRIWIDDIKVYTK